MLRYCWILGLLASIGAPLLRADSFPAGSGRLDFANGGDAIAVFTYRPPAEAGGPIFVAFSGGERDARGTRDSLIAAARRFHALVVAPLLDAERFPYWRYQLGGVVDPDGHIHPRAAWTFALVPRIVDHVRRLLGRPGAPCYLIGHSAGGQFLARFAAFWPTDAVRIVAANPGSDLFPSRDQPFGYGFGGLPTQLGDDRALRAYLAAPLTLYLGTADTAPRPSFDSSAEAMRQGESRLARGRACFAAAAALARERRWTFGWKKVEAPGAGHDESAMYGADAMAEALLGPR
ncbi:MAG TPA: hypothetical protein VHC86_11910 [Opitutaceae bacterium]|nr:hypothetical protein [Opitutaceae bacterium]